MDESHDHLPPLRLILGDAMDALAPAVREHFSQTRGIRRYTGVLTVWRRAGIRGWLARPVLSLFRRSRLFVADIGADVPFEMLHTMQTGRRGTLEMAWSRRLEFPQGPRQFEGILSVDAGQKRVVEWLGPHRVVEADVSCRVVGNELHTRTGRQWWHACGLRIPVPGWLCGVARLREWERVDGTLGTTLTIRNPILGDFMGWNGWFRPVIP